MKVYNSNKNEIKIKYKNKNLNYKPIINSSITEINDNDINIGDTSVNHNSFNIKSKIIFIKFIGEIVALIYL